METINVCIVHSNGSLEEIDSILRDKFIYIDLNTKRIFNPYVLEAAAYGLLVFTTSDLYDFYGYKNIIKIGYEKINAIYDNSFFLNPDNSVKKELCYYRRKLKISDLIKSILCSDWKINSEQLIEVNEKNSWKRILSDESVRKLF